MHILYLTSFYPSDDHSHHGIFFRDHANALAKAHTVSVINIQVPSLKSSGQWLNKIDYQKEDKVHVYRASFPVLTHRLEKGIHKQELRAINQAFDHLIKDVGKPDFIIVQCSLPGGLWALELKRNYGIPYGIIEHFSFLDEQISEACSAMRTVYSESSFIGIVSTEHLSLINLKFKLEVKVVNNVLGQEFESLDSGLNLIAQNLFKLLFIGYNNSKKGIDILLNSIHLLHLKHNHFALTLVGHNLTDLFKELQNYGVNVTYLPSTTRDEMLSLMLQHHALISTSRKETFGMAIIEMLSLGRPVVVTPSGGPNQYMNDRLGYITKDFNPKSVANALQELIANYTSFDPSGIRNEIIDRYGSQAYIKQIESIIHV